MPTVARVLTAELTLRDPPNAEAYRQRHNEFVSSLAPLTEKIASLKARFAGTPVTATEPVFGYMAGALGLDMRNGGFQLAIMNATEPSPRQVAAFEKDLRLRTVKVLIYNSQVSDDTTSRLKRIAERRARGRRHRNDAGRDKLCAVDGRPARCAASGLVEERPVSAICFQKVTLSHGHRHTLEKASFDIAAGTFIGLLGANGAGKTTLLRGAPWSFAAARRHDRGAGVPTIAR